MNNLENKKFGRLSVIEFAYSKNNRLYWLCRCNCGNKKIVQGTRLVLNHTKSCGCLQKEIISTIASIIHKENKYRRTHGMTYTNFYGTWWNMIYRCTQPKSREYKYYGARGIKIEWKSFEEFHRDMYKSYLEHRKRHTNNRDTTIERKNNNGNYSKENCVWATQAEQHLNMRKRGTVVTLR